MFNNVGLTMTIPLNMCVKLCIRPTLKTATAGESPSAGHKSRLRSFHNVGYTIDADVVFSAENSAVTICRILNTGSRSSITIQCFSRNSSVLASDGLVTLRSLSTATTGQRSSVGCSNMSYTLFQRVLTYWISFFGSPSVLFISFCLFMSSVVAKQLWLKCPTSLLAAPTHLLMAVFDTLSTPSPEDTTRCSLCAAQAISCQPFAFPTSSTFAAPS